MESVARIHPHTEARPRSRFYQENGYWYFTTARGETIGPFDRVYKITMGERFMGEWQYEQTEVTGQEMAQLLT